MKKINLAKEKRLMNETYAKRFEKKDEDRDKRKKKEKKVPKFANWCRTKGHPASCAVISCPQK